MEKGLVTMDELYDILRTMEREELGHAIKEAGGAVPYLIGEIESRGWNIKTFYIQMSRNSRLDELWRGLKEYERNAIYVHFLTSKQ